MTSQLRAVFALWTGKAVSPAPIGPLFCIFGACLQIYWGGIFAVAAVITAAALVMKIEEGRAEEKWRLAMILVGWGLVPSGFIGAFIEPPIFAVPAFLLNGVFVGRSVAASLSQIRPLVPPDQGEHEELRRMHQPMTIDKGPVIGRFKDASIHQWVEVDGIPYWFERTVHVQVFELFDGELVVPPGLVYKRNID